MSIAIRKVWRDLWNNKGRTTLVVLSIAVGVMAVGMIFSSNSLISRQLSIAQGSDHLAHAFLVLDGAVNTDTIASLARVPGVTDVDGWAQTTLRWKPALDAEWKDATLIAVEDYDHQQLNVIGLRSGDWPGANTLAVQFNHVEPYSVPATGNTIYFEINNRVKPVKLGGIVRDPFQLPPPFAQSVAFYATPAMLEKLAGFSGFNYIRFTINGDTQDEVKAVAEALEDKINRAGVSVAAIQTYKPGDHPFQETLDGFGIVLLVMAVASLGLSTFLVVNTINAIIAQQIPQIGIMKTVGGIRSEIAQLYLAGVAVYGFLSLVLAVPLGAFGGDILSRGLLTTLNIPVAPFEVLPISFVYQILAGLLTPLLAALWPVVQGTAISVREAIASYGLGQGKYGGRLMDKIMGRVQGLPRMLTLALRNTFRRMGRVILTEITLVAAGAIFMMIVATSSSFNSTLDEFWKGFGFDVLMGFNQPQRIDKVIPQIEAHSGVQFAEMWIWQSAKIKKVGATGPGSELKIDLRAVPEDTKLYTPQLTAGRALDPNDGHALLMDQKMAKELGISVGDHVVLTFVGAGESQWTVVGLIFDVIGNLAFVTGAFWDEVWHRLYGIGSAVNDFLWRPHLMIYGSMGLTALFAFGGLFIALRGQGDVRARFRSEPLIGLLGLAASYLACSTFSDLIWHQIYGLDITAWSLPHIFLGTGSAFVMLATVALLAAQVSRRDWRGLAGLQLPETLAIVMTGAAAMITAQVAATEWDGIRVIGDPNRIAFWARPEWIYPVVVISLAVFFSAFLIQALRRAGVATLTTLAALGVRALYFALFGLWENRTGMALTAQLLMIPAAVALDAWYAFRLKRAGEAATLTLGNLLAGVAFVIISLPLIPRLMIYPRLNAGTLPMMVGFSLLAALWFGWIGARLGAWLGGLGGEAKESAEAMSPRISRRTLRVGLGMLAAFILFALLFILTARPPNT